MIICKNCEVELEDDMLTCPLCRQPVGTESLQSSFQGPIFYSKRMSAPQKKFTWEIVSLILLSAIVATFIVNFIIDRRITWAEYPVSISLIIFSYLSLFAFWRQQTVLQLLAGFILSSLCILVLDFATGGIDWALLPGIPLVFAATIVVILMHAIINAAKHKGINLLAWGFLCAGFLCICVESVLSYYKLRQINLNWSIIAGTCIIPIALVLLFVHFRLKKGKNLERTLHV
jgi:hypothetical protein